MSEHEEQTTFFDWVRLNRERALNLEVRKAMKLCYAVPNGFYSKSFKVVNDMIAEGLTKGILDINLDWPTFRVGLFYHGSTGTSDERSEMRLTGHAGLRVEMKYRNPNELSAKIKAKIATGEYLVDLSPEQREKRALLLEAGYVVKVCYSAAQAIREVVNYLPFEKKDYQGIKEFLG